MFVPLTTDTITVPSTITLPTDDYSFLAEFPWGYADQRKDTGPAKSLLAESAYRYRKPRLSSFGAAR